MTSRRKLGLSLFLFVVLVTAVNAHADGMDTFTLTGSGSTITFTLPATVTCCSPGEVTTLFSGNGTLAEFSGFEIDGVQVTVNGSTSTENIDFFTNGTGGTVSNGGGLSIGTFSGATPFIVSELGDQLFALNNYPTSPFAATFISGSTSLTVCPADICGSTPTVNNDLSLTITPSATTVPEPSTILLVGSGFVGLLGAARRKLRM